MKIELTPQEAQVVINLFDIAVRARGMEVAEAALVLTQRIKKAAEEQKPELSVVDPAA
jgi:hypothetical protein